MAIENDPNAGYRSSVEFRFDGSEVTQIVITPISFERGSHVVYGAPVGPFLDKWQELKVHEQPKFLRAYVEMMTRPKTDLEVLQERFDVLLHRLNVLEAERAANTSSRSRHDVERGPCACGAWH